MVNYYKNITDYLIKQGNVPKMLGFYHLLCVGIVIFLVYLFIKLFKNVKENQFRLITFICWLILVTFELYKQWLFYFGIGATSYQWIYFPFQFCSTPLYVLPFIVFLKDSKFRDGLIGYMAWYSLFAGLCVYGFPTGVFCAYVGINIQTMVHHGMQIVLGFYMAYHLREHLCLKVFFKSMLVFICLLSVAVILNSTIKASNLNLFFVNPKLHVGMPILTYVQDNFPYPVFFLTYLFGFSFCAFLLYLINCLINKKKPFKWNC